MAKKIHIEKKETEEVKVEAPKVEEAKVAAPIEEKKEVKTSDWPEITATGRYVAVEYKDGYVVYNPIAVRITGVISKIEAEDIVRQQNTAAHIKG